MIPASHISFNSDGTAWLIVDDDDDLLFGPPTLKGLHLDRPCDTQVCHDGFISTGMYQTECTACDGTGRHTFDIEVECIHFDTPESPMINCWNCEAGRITHRVSVVPGMVLPIVDEQDAMDGKTIPAACVLYRVPTGEVWFWGRPQDGVRSITLPPAAAPGMWAVQLKVSTP